MRTPRGGLGHATYDGFQQTRYFSALDGLRALSVIAVIWQHTSGNPGPAFFSKGGFGVQCFFAISGFLITTLLLRERRRSGRISLKGFYIRRTLRIMPIYYLVLGAYVLLVVTLRRGTAEGEQFFDNLPAFLTYTSNWFVDLHAGNSVTFYFAWSLATEEQFYIFWPLLLIVSLLIARVLGRGGILVPIVALTIIIAVNQLALAAGSEGFATTVISSLALPILLSSALAVALDNQTVFNASAPVLSASWFAPAMLVGMLASLVWETPAQVTEVMLVLLVVALSVTEKTILHPALRWRPLVHIGIVSYGVYLMHMLCANVVRLVLDEEFGVALFACTTVLVIVVASVSYRIVESPLQRLGRRLTRGRPGTGVSHAATDPSERRRRAKEAG